MSYLYETHCHVNVSSACSALTPKELVRLYVANGYQGVFLTDHFLNGNCVQACREGSYLERLSAFYKSFEAVQKEAEGKLDVFFGFEYSYKGTDVLTYGLTIDDLRSLDYERFGMRMRAFIDYAKERGALTVQAHPFREASYIDHIRLFPGCEAVETFNACRTILENKMARMYASEYGKRGIGGSDIHSVSQPVLSGIATEEKIKTATDFLKIVRSGNYQIIEQTNVLSLNKNG